MNALELLNAFSDRTGLLPISGVSTDTNPQTRQLKALLYELLDYISVTPGFQMRRQEVVWNSTATESQGNLETRAPGCTMILPQTFWNRTTRKIMVGPVSEKDWQALKATPFTGPLYQYIIRNNEILVTPRMPAGHVLAFEYYDNRLVRKENGTFAQYSTADSDTFLVSDQILLAGLRWKWKYEKGQEYGEDFRLFEQLMANVMAVDGTKPIIDQALGRPKARPGVLIPEGNWPVA